MKLKYFVELTRPKNLIFIILTVIFGIYYKNSYTFHLRSFFAIISTVLIAGGGYAINDFFDIKADIINRPDRILPSGKLTPKAAYLFSVISIITGINLSVFTFKWIMFFVAFVNAVLLFYYAKRMKKEFLTGNILVAYTSASTFIYGALLSNNFHNCLWIILFAFFLTLIREIVKDMEDISGDSAIDASTLPLHLGVPKTSVIVTLLSFIPLSINIFAYISNSVSSLYFVLTTVLVFIPVILISFYLIKSSQKRRFSQASSLLKILMLVVLGLTLFL